MGTREYWGKDLGSLGGGYSLVAHPVTRGYDGDIWTGRGSCMSTAPAPFSLPVPS